MLKKPCTIINGSIYNDTPYPTKFVSASLAEFSDADNLEQSLQMALQLELLSTKAARTFVLREMLSLFIAVARDSNFQAEKRLNIFKVGVMIEN